MSDVGRSGPVGDAEGGEVRMHAGVGPATNLALCLLGLVGGAVVLTFGIGVLVTTRGTDEAWAALGALLSVGFLAVMALGLLASANALRPVVLREGRDGWLSLPVGPRWRRVTVPLREVRTVELEYRSEPRNGRWQLVVRDRDRRWVTDSVTSQKNGTADVAVRSTPAYACVRRLRAAVVEAQA